MNEQGTHWRYEAWWTEKYIGEVTGFDNGDCWETPADVQEYFQVSTLENCMHGWLIRAIEDGIIKDRDDATYMLISMAKQVIRHAYWCTFNAKKGARE